MAAPPLQVLDVVRIDVGLLPFAFRGGQQALVFLGQLANILKPRVATDRPGIFPDDLQAVVIRRIVACRYHDAAIGTEMRRREIDHFGATEADVEDLNASVSDAAAYGVGEFCAGQANIPADDQALCAKELGRGVADSIHDVGIQLVRDLPTDVVGLEAVD